MNWREIEIICDRNLEEIIYSILYQFPITSIEVEDYQDVLNFKKIQPYWVVIDENVKAIREEIIIRTYLEDNADNYYNIQKIDQLLENVKKNHPEEIQYHLDKSIEDKDWSEEWKKGYKPFKIGGSLVIKPTWENYNNQEGDIVLEIDPGMAFGTGTHETTSLTLIELENLNLKGKKVLDVGGGSGILSIAALLYGAKSAHAVDIDPLAVKASKENAIINKVEENFTAEVMDILSEKRTSEQYDIVVSNTLYFVLVSLIPKLGDYLKKNGMFVCSGVLKKQEEDMKLCLANYGYETVRVREDGEWISIVAVNKNV